MQYYGLSFILYELSTPFLNIHWFLDKFNMTGSKIQLYNGILLVSSFVLCRLIWGSYSIVRMVYDLWIATRSVNIQGAYTEAIDSKLDPFARIENIANDKALPLWLVGTFIGGNVVLWSLNVFWLGQMIKAMRKRFTPTLEDKKDK
jgi:hypothetical protein